MSSKVLNVHKLSGESYVYIGRPSMFGNSYKISPGGRTKAVADYRKYFLARIESDSEFKAAVLKLKGQNLGCFCAPLSCHGDVILEWLNGNADKQD